MIGFIKNHKDKLLKIVGCIVFFALLFDLYLHITYLFRGNQYNYNDRIAVVGLKEEAEDSIDVIYIGGSAAFVYWEPLKAYNDYGFTSYDLATNTIQAESILSYVKYAQKYQNPDLYVIGVRAFQYYGEEGDEVGLRNASDSLDIGFNRVSLINKYLSNRNLDADIPSLYLDVAKYHTNYDALKNSTAWGLMDNSMKSDDKGCKTQERWCYFERPENVKTDERSELLANDTKTLIELLEYLKDNNLNALFVVCPYLINEEDYSKYNTISDIVADYGYYFLNTNDYYDEMGLDFAMDFYNADHVNVRGANKYTEFLGDYLVQNYGLPNHKEDEAYQEWEELANDFVSVTDASIGNVEYLAYYAQEAYQIAESVRNTENVQEWLSLVNDDRFTVIAAGSCNFSPDEVNADVIVSLEQSGLLDMFYAQNYIKLLCNAEMITANSDGSTSISANIGNSRFTVPCDVDNADGNAQIIINGDNVSCSQKDKINIVVFDNNHRCIVDSVYLSCDDGNVTLMRK